MAKQKTKADIAFGVQKFFKRISIDLKFLDSITIWTEEDSFFFSSIINPFFIMKGKIGPEFKEFSQELFSDLKKNTKYTINFLSDNFIRIKKSLKKNMIEYENLVLKCSDDNGEYDFRLVETENYTAIENFKSKKQFKILDGSFKNCLRVFDRENKILELPEKNIYGYSGGDLLYEIEDTSNPEVKKSKLSFNSNNINFELYFKTIV